MKRLIFILIIFLLFPSIAWPATKYVDVNDGDCGDNGSWGSAVSPYCQVDFAVGDISSGDTLWVKDGNYTGNPITITNLSATTGTPTWIIAENVSQGPLSTSGATLLNTGWGGGRIIIDNTDHLVFEGFNITFGNYGIEVRDGSSGITIRNNTIWNIGQQEIYIHESSWGVLVSGNTISDGGNYINCGAGQAFECNGEGVYIGSASGSAPADNTHDIRISGNTIYDFTDEAIDLKGGTYNVIIEGNVMYDYDDGTADGDWYTSNRAVIEVYPHNRVVVDKPRPSIPC